MVCQPRKIIERKSTAAYGQQITIKGESHLMWQRWRVVYEECGAELASASMKYHLQKQHGR